MDKKILPLRTRNKVSTKIPIDRLKEDVAQYSDAYQYERAERLGVSKSGIQNRVESLFTETPSHTTVQAMSHTAVLLLCLPKANERLKSPNLLNHSRFIALCTI